MGRLVRRYIRAYRINIRRDIRLGTWASPLTQAVAAQNVLQSQLNVSALGGTCYAAFFGLQMSASATGDLRGLRIKTNIGTGLTLTGTSYGLYIELETSGTSTLTGAWEAIRIELYSNSTSTLSGDTIVMHIANYLEKAPTGAYYMMRLAETHTVATVHAFFWCSASKANYLFNLAGTGPAAWDTGVDHTGNASGGIKCVVGGLDRWIQLYV